jgi:hypothetical protein
MISNLSINYQIQEEESQAAPMLGSRSRASSTRHLRLVRSMRFDDRNKAQIAALQQQQSNGCPTVSETATTGSNRCRNRKAELFLHGNNATVSDSHSSNINNSGSSHSGNSYSGSSSHNSNGTGKSNSSIAGAMNTNPPSPTAPRYSAAPAVRSLHASYHLKLVVQL